MTRTLADVDTITSRIGALLRPSGSVMDLNLGAALWMAARGVGQINSDPQLNYSSDRTAFGDINDVNNGTDSVERVKIGVGGPDPDRRRRRPSHTSCASYCPDPDHSKDDRLRSHDLLIQSASTDTHTDADTTNWYRSAARVVLVGHGADELFGGYSRHRTRYRQGGSVALSEELRLDVRRMWRRNLGRDDRLVADVGREARHPFLAEGVARAAMALGPGAGTRLGRPPGEGDKRVLRAVLAVGLGCPRAGRRVKRAMQFGTRIGKASNKRLFGSNRRANKHHAAYVPLGGIPDL